MANVSFQEGGFFVQDMQAGLPSSPSVNEAPTMEIRKKCNIRQFDRILGCVGYGHLGCGLSGHSNYNANCGCGVELNRNVPNSKPS